MTTPQPAPISFADIPDEWFATVRTIIRRDGAPVRPHATLPSIEVKSLTTNQWMPLMLHGSGILFSSGVERDLAMGRIS